MKTLIKVLNILEIVGVIASFIYALVMITFIVIGIFWMNISFWWELGIIFVPSLIITILLISIHIVLSKNCENIIQYCIENTITDYEKGIFKQALTIYYNKKKKNISLDSVLTGVMRVICTSKSMCDELFFDKFEEIFEKVKQDSSESSINAINREYEKYKTPSAMKSYKKKQKLLNRIISTPYYVWAFKYALFVLMLFAYIMGFVEKIPTLTVNSSSQIREYIFNGCAVTLLGMELVFSRKDFFFLDKL